MQKSMKVLGRMPNISIQAFHSNVMYTIFQTFYPLGKINPWQQFKSSPIVLERRRTWQPCIIETRAAGVRFD